MAEPQATSAGDRRRLFGPAILSAFFYPGAGQFTQGRVAAGVAFAALFTILVVGFFVSAGTILYRYYTFPMSDSNPNLLLPISGLIFFFVSALLVWSTNVLDAWLRGCGKAVPG